MTSPNDVHRLRREGLSIRQIAARLGLSRTKVHRWLTRPLEFDSGDDGEVYPPPPPWTFVGYEGDEERWIDRHGRSVDALARYRWRAYQQNDFDDYETVEAVDADMDRQRAEWNAHR